MYFYTSIAFVVLFLSIASLCYQAEQSSKLLKESLTKNGIDFIRSCEIKKKLGYRINGESLVNYQFYVKGGRWLYRANDGKSGTLQELIKERGLQGNTKPFKAQFGSFY